MAITFERSAAKFVMDAFPDEPRECGVCGSEVTPDNLAGVVNDVGFVCNSTVCLIDIASKIPPMISGGES